MQWRLQFGVVGGMSLASLDFSLTWLLNIVSHKEDGQFVTKILDGVLLVFHSICVGLGRSWQHGNVFFAANDGQFFFVQWKMHFDEFSVRESEYAS